MMFGHSFLSLKTRVLLEKDGCSEKKRDEQGKVVRKKSRLIVKGYNHQEDIDFTKTFPPVARLEAIRIMLAFVVHKNMSFSKGC